MAVVSVVINRWQNGKWGQTLDEVVYAPEQFSPANLLYKTTPSETNYAAVDYVLKNGSILPKYCMYFRSEFCFSDIWEGYNRYTQIDAMYFGYFVTDKNNYHTMN
jgi:spore germination cell wall hydrolase CwlJ-like protein